MNDTFPYKTAAKFCVSEDDELKQLIASYKNLYDNYRQILIENTELKQRLHICERTVGLLQVQEDI